MHPTSPNIYEQCCLRILLCSSSVAQLYFFYKSFLKRNQFRVIVCFGITGKELNINELTEALDIIPTQIRGIDDWPEIIKKDLTLTRNISRTLYFEVFWGNGC